MLLLALACTGPADDSKGDDDDDDDVVEDLEPVELRVASFNVSLFRDDEGELIDDLSGDSEAAEGIAAILERVDPDLILLNELDYDSEGEAVSLLQEWFADPFEHVYVAPSNTGVHSGFDLDNSGSVTSTPGSPDYGGDAFGFGTFEGQYAFAVLSRYPLGDPRTFQTLLWRDVPDNVIPDGWFDDDELDVVRLSSKNHVDVPVDVDGHTLHFLVSHPTPPSFDGSEDRNGRRNYDEIGLWARYIDGDDAFPTDDAGTVGGLAADDSFVIAGDLNADPFDGDSRDGAIDQLLDHARVQADPVPSSLGGTEQAELQGSRNSSHDGDPAHDTADFNDNSVGNLRLDYVLPSDDVDVVAAGVFWPEESDPDFDLVGTFPFPVSDHRLVWIDIELQ